MSKGFLEFVEGEVQTVQFDITYKDTGEAVSMVGTTCTLEVKQAGEEEFTEVDADFTKSSGRLLVTCSLVNEGLYDGILTVVFGGGTTKKHLFGIKVKGTD